MAGGQLGPYTRPVAAAAPGLGGGKEVLIFALGAGSVFLLFFTCRYRLRRFGRRLDRLFGLGRNIDRLDRRFGFSHFLRRFWGKAGSAGNNGDNLRRGYMAYHGHGQG